MRGIRHRPRTDLKGRKKENITRIRVVFCEYDRNDNVTDFSLKAVLDNLKLPLEPTMVVQTSRGKYHLYWCISDDWPADTDGVRDFTNVMERMVETYHSDQTPWIYLGCFGSPGIITANMSRMR